MKDTTRNRLTALTAAVLLGLVLSLGGCGTGETQPTGSDQYEEVLPQEEVELEDEGLPQTGEPTGEAEAPAPETEKPQEETEEEPSKPATQPETETPAREEESLTQQLTEGFGWEDDSQEIEDAILPESSGKATGSAAARPNSSKDTGEKTTITPVDLTEQEEQIAYAAGQTFAMFRDPNGTASLGLKLYRGGELVQDYGYYQGDWSQTGETVLMLVGQQPEENNRNRLEYRWRTVQLCGNESYTQDLPTYYPDDNRSLIRQRVRCGEEVQVQSGKESVLAYIAYRDGVPGEDAWQQRDTLAISGTTTLDQIEKQLANYRYCYVITATIQ